MHARGVGLTRCQSHTVSHTETGTCTRARTHISTHYQPNPQLTLLATDLDATSVFGRAPIDIFFGVVLEVDQVCEIVVEVLVTQILHDLSGMVLAAAAASFLCFDLIHLVN